jgi:hypothetical protein
MLVVDPRRRKDFFRAVFAGGRQFYDELLAAQDRQGKESTMHLPESDIIAGLQHPSVFVRETVAEFLVDCHRTQADVTRPLIAAVEQFGWREVLQFPHRVASFELDDFSLDWLLVQLTRRDGDGPGENQRWHLAGMLATAPIALARPHLADILAIEVMHRDRTKLQRSRTSAELLELRNEFWHLGAEECWQRLEAHCQDVADVETFDEADVPLAKALVERLAWDDGSAGARALEVLERTEPHGDKANPWLPGLMIDLAGRLRLEAAAPLIYRQFARDWDWYNEEVMYALTKLGGPSVTALVSEKYAGSPEHVRLYSCGVLEDVHHDRSVEHVLSLLPHEDDEFNRGQLGVALASHFDERGVEPALEIYREDPDDAERLTIIDRLYAHACLADLDRPELEQWREWIESDWKHLTNSRGLLDRFATALDRHRDDWTDDAWFDADALFGNDNVLDSVPASGLALREEENYSPPRPIVREAERVGRNERCPCGSGQKYKNCCLRGEEER